MDGIIRGSRVCRVALSKDNQPYLVPMSFGYDGRDLYFHTASEGKKLEYFRANPQVCFEFERQVALRQHPQNACQWTFSFESVIGYGTISELLEPAEKARALNEIMKQYSGKEWSFESASLAVVRVWKVAITTMTGKQSLPKESLQL
jgi:nitroimidazol reductase NimA-like FMN-containing flavoprotein (pyridoxamine 5'-phosphate oxidase superfamily)